MTREKKLAEPVSLFVTIESKYHDALRIIAFSQRRSLADVVREVVAEFVDKRPETLKAASRLSFGEPKTEKVHKVHA